MTDNDSDNIDFTLADGSLDTADAVARTAHIWIRSICLNEMQSEEERYALAGGLVAGLCDNLALNPKVRELVAYVYTLLNSEGGQALAISRIMLDQSVPASSRHAYERGRTEAAGIVEMLAFHNRKYPAVRADR